MLFARLDKDSSAEALKALEEIEGIDAEASKADDKKGEIHVKLAGEDEPEAEGEKLTVETLVKALDEAGIKASPTKDEARKS